MTKVWFIIMSLYMADGSLTHKVLTPPNPSLNNELECKAQAETYQKQLVGAPELVKARIDCDYMDVSKALGQVASE